MKSLIYSTKRHLILLFLILFSFNVSSQVIDSMKMIPQTPTAADTLTFYVYSTFFSGIGLNCHGTNEYSFENNIIASSSLHCIGVSTTVCSDVDTFKINPLPEGEYTFIHNLFKGLGIGIPCESFGGVQDIDSLTFSIGATLGFTAFPNIINLPIVFPNPFTEKCILKFNSPTSECKTLEVFDVSQRFIFQKNITDEKEVELDFTHYPAGIYYLKVGEVSRILIKR